jgi:hypothetical protein
VQANGKGWPRTMTAPSVKLISFPITILYHICGLLLIAIGRSRGNQNVRPSNKFSTCRADQCKRACMTERPTELHCVGFASLFWAQSSANRQRVLSFSSTPSQATINKFPSLLFPSLFYYLLFHSSTPSLSRVQTLAPSMPPFALAMSRVAR